MASLGVLKPRPTFLYQRVPALPGIFAAFLAPVFLNLCGAQNRRAGQGLHELLLGGTAPCCLLAFWRASRHTPQRLASLLPLLAWARSALPTHPRFRFTPICF
jgi:hypothetical protein